jgi:hypothetical protein
MKVADKINYLQATSENKGGWNRQQTSTVVNGNQTLLAMHKCLLGSPDLKVNILENVRDMLSECRRMCGMEIRGLAGGWKEIVTIQSRFCKKMQGLPGFAENSVAG